MQHSGMHEDSRAVQKKETPDRILLADVQQWSLGAGSGDPVCMPVSHVIAAKISRDSAVKVLSNQGRRPYLIGNSHPHP